MAATLIVPTDPAADRPDVERRPVLHRRPVLGHAGRPTTQIRIRAIDPTDHLALQAFYAALSDESRRTRFLGPSRGIGSGQSAYFCTPDHDHREGFVALMGPGDRTDRIVGHVCVEPDGPNAAEIAIAVADDVQHRGIGRQLTEAAVEWARREGLAMLTATMLADNPAIQRLLSSLGLPSVATPIGAGVVEIRILLPEVPPVAAEAGAAAD